jgi:hypothetical protein
VTDDGLAPPHEALHAINYSVRNHSRGRRKMKQLVPAQSRPSLMDHPISSAPRLGRAEPPALNSSFSLHGRTTRALDTKSATVAPARSGVGGKSFTDDPHRPKGLLPGICWAEPPNLGFASTRRMVPTRLSNSIGLASNSSHPVAMAFSRSLSTACADMPMIGIPLPRPRPKRS